MVRRRAVLDSPAASVSFPGKGLRDLSPAVPVLAGILVVGLLAPVLYLVPTYAAYVLAWLGLGIPLLLLVWNRPEFGLLVLVFLTSSFVPADIVDVRLPIGGGLELRDLVLMAMLGLLLFQGLIRKSLTVPWWPVGLPLLVLLGFGLLSAFYAIRYQGVAMNWALRDLRTMAFYGVCLVTGWAITKPRQLSILLVGMFVFANLTAGIVIIQQFLGADQRLLAAMATLGTEWQVWQQSTDSTGFGLVRIVPPGHVLMYLMMVMAFALLLVGQNTRRQRTILVFEFAFLNLGLLLTYTRAQWIAAAVAMALVFTIAMYARKARLVPYLFLGVLVLLVLLSVLGSETQGMLARVPVLDAVTARVFSIFTPEETLDTLSLEWRRFETEAALRSIAEHPLLGVGLGNSYRDLTLLRGEAAGGMLRSLDPENLYRYTRFLHNSYLSIAVKMGLPALLCLLWLCAAFLAGGWQLYRRLSCARLKGIVLATQASFVGLLLWSILHPHFIEAQSTPVIGLMIGLVACIQALHARTMEPPPYRRQVPAHVAGYSGPI